MSNIKILDNLNEIANFIKSSIIEDEDADDIIKSDDEDADDEDGEDEEEDEDEDDEDGDMEKSAIEELIDAEPVLKAVRDNIDYNNKRIDKLIKAVESMVNVMKSSENDNINIMKSLKEDVNKISGEAMPTPGVYNAQSLLRNGAIMTKSIGGKKEVDLPVSISLIKSILVNGEKKEMIKSGETTMFELNPNLTSLDPNTQLFVRKVLSKEVG